MVFGSELGTDFILPFPEGVIDVMVSDPQLRAQSDGISSIWYLPGQRAVKVNKSLLVIMLSWWEEEVSRRHYVSEPTSKSGKRMSAS